MPGRRHRLEIDECIFEFNSAGERGGAIHIDRFADPDGQIVRASTFLHCTAAESGGAIDCEVAAEFTDLDIRQCSAGEGGGLFLGPYGSIELDTCTIAQSQAGIGGGVFIIDGLAGEVAVVDTLLCANMVDDIAGPYEDLGGNAFEDTCPWNCTEDITGDGIVGTSDLLVVLARWGTDSSSADINQDGIVGVDDLLLIIVAWGPCGE